MRTTSDLDDGADEELEALRSSSAADFTDRSPVALVALDGSDHVVEANATFADWVGRDVRTLLHRPFADVLSAGSRLFAQTHVYPRLALKGEIDGIALDLVTPGGERRHVLMTARGYRRRDGSLGIARAALFDARERRGYELELLRQRRAAEESLRMTSALMRMVGHDLRSPLSAIGYAAESLSIQGADPDDLALIERSRKLVLGLADQIVEFERIRDGVEASVPVEFDLRGELADLIDSVRRTSLRPGVELVLDVGPDVPERLVGRPLNLVQIFANLIGNAAKFTYSGRIDVRVGLVDGSAERVRLFGEVGDTGIGIAADELEHVLKPFAQSSERTDDRQPGFGLGLSIVVALLEKLGGELRIESEEGTGSRFRFEAVLGRAATGDRAGPAAPLA